MVYKLTEQQKDTIIGKEYSDGMLFNPVQDVNDVWVISKEEVDQSQDPLGWVKNLPQIEYEPVISTATLISDEDISNDGWIVDEEIY